MLPRRHRLFAFDTLGALSARGLLEPQEYSTMTSLKSYDRAVKLEAAQTTHAAVKKQSKAIEGSAYRAFSSLCSGAFPSQITIF